MELYYMIGVTERKKSQTLLDICKELDFKGALLIGHIGKLVKLGGGMMNTHSKYGDCRTEILSAMAGAEGVDAGTIRAMLECVSCDDCLRLLGDRKEKVLLRLMERIRFHLQYRAGDMEIGCAMFSKEYGLLGRTENAEELAGRILRQRLPLGEAGRAKP